ncbi:MAG: carboxypeptidase-like regulatory domain-containing protein [Muribaculaceae bacterium]|nr:carboxypeptidase-like regulatory domain-containing protein [Muribaculaceae bacterium]
MMYEKGKGVSINYEEAYKWYKKAADNGNENAKKWIAKQSMSTGSNALTVTGRVVDESGDGLIGVSVSVAGAKTGTVTDLDGNFTLKNVPDGATLNVSYVGYSPQSIKVTSKNASGLLIKMK